MLLEELHQFRKVVNMRKRDFVGEQNGFQRFLGSLLGLKTKVFPVDARFVVLRLKEVASRSIQLLPWIIWRKPLMHHKSLFLPEGQVQSPKQGTCRNARYPPG